MDNRSEGQPRAGLVTPGDRTLELAERRLGDTIVRLFWREGTEDVWLQIRLADEGLTTTIAVAPERALDAFRHPFAYADLLDSSGFWAR